MSNRDIEDLAGEGVYYNSFDHLSAGLHRMMKRGHQFRIASSDILRNVDGNQDEKFRYRCLVFHCVHFGQPRKRGKGARQSSYLATGCQAFIRVNYNYTYKSLEVSKSHLSHRGHKLHKEPVGRHAICTTQKVNSDFPSVNKEAEQLFQSKRRSTRVVPRFEFKHLSPEKQLQEQSEYVDFLLAKQRRNYVLYAKQRANLGLPPFAFNPPPLTYATLLDFYQLSHKPYVVPKIEQDSGDEYGGYMEHPNDSVVSNDQSEDAMQVVKNEEIASTDNNYDQNEATANEFLPTATCMENYPLLSDENSEYLLSKNSEDEIKEEIVGDERSVYVDVCSPASPQKAPFDEIAV